MTVDLLPYIWQSQFFNGSKHMLSRIETTLLSQSKQKWQSDVHTSSKCFYLSQFKQKWQSDVNVFIIECI